ncbi:unnamed protein product [Lactuca virosa]|uniref:Ubiquitin-like protease family profile domain-containing protein n=1 Tax=Lactuca virosa TaxID=75947 RepID=A0AAU9LJY5_9ASTR|nr:unnamed protein product [Lactuca virosa]
MLHNSSKNTSFPSSSHQLKIPRPLTTPNNRPDKVNPRGKRHPPKPTYLKSPYIVGALDITTRLSQSDKSLSEWVFSTQGAPSDEVFRTCAGVSAQRFHMESFFTDCELLFAPITVTSLYLENTALTAEARKFLFFSNLSDCIDAEGLTLRDVRLLFLPVVRDFHIFLFVIDLQQPSFTIIDNIRQDDTHQVAYGSLPDLVHSYMTDYMRSVQHHFYETFANVPIQILQLPWETINNSTDCGVLTMRHMETFMGGNVKAFKAGFKPESVAQKKQLAKLRILYLCKILTSDFNLLKASILQESAEFESLHGSQKQEIMNRAATTIHDRLREFG